MLKNLLVSYGDSNPDPFTFLDSPGVIANTPVSSDPVIITGLNKPTPFTTISGSASINGGDFITSGTINNNDSIVLKRVSSPLEKISVYVKCIIGNLSADWKITTRDIVIDFTPDPIIFENIIDSEFNITHTTETIAVSGINITSGVPVTASGGLISVNGGSFASSGRVVEGDGVSLQAISGPTYESITEVIYKVGSYSSKWVIRNKKYIVVPPDANPDPFSFIAQNGLIRSMDYVSNTVTITGITSAEVSVTNGYASINGGPYASTGVVLNNQTITLKGKTSGQYSSTVGVICTVGSLTRTWNITTEGDLTDLIPDSTSFVYTTVTNLERSVEVISNSCKVTGINAPLTISMTNGLASLDGVNFLPTIEVTNNQYVTLKATSSTSLGTTVAVVGNALLSSYTFTWNVSTRQPIVIPTCPANINQVVYNNQWLAPLNTTIYGSTYDSDYQPLRFYGNEVEVSLYVKADQTGYPEIQINGGAWVGGSSSDSAPVTIPISPPNGTPFDIRLKTANGYNKQTNFKVITSSGQVNILDWVIKTRPTIIPADSFSFYSKPKGVIGSGDILSNVVSVTRVNPSDIIYFAYHTVPGCNVYIIKNGVQLLIQPDPAGGTTPASYTNVSFTAGDTLQLKATAGYAISVRYSYLKMVNATADVISVGSYWNLT